MARLSEEHYKSNPGTPQPERKTNRFREIFKHHPSSSASSSPNLLTKTQSESSPAMPQTMKTGFKKISILPSEQSSFENARRILNRFEESTSSGWLRDSMRDYGSAGNETPVKTHTKNLEVKNEATETSPFSATATHKSMEIESSPRAHPGHNFAKDSIEKDVTPFKRFNQVVAPARDPPAPALSELAESPLPLDVINPSTETVDESFFSCDDQDSDHDSFYSNNFGGEDGSLSQAIREYMVNKIARAVEEHDVKRASEEREVAVTCAQPNTKAIVYNFVHKAVKEFVGRDGDEIDLWTYPKSIGTLTINHGHAAILLQYAMIVFLAVSILEAAFSGPKDLLLVLWKWAVVSGTYASALKYFGSIDDVSQDLLLAPMIYGVQKLHTWGKKMMSESEGPTQSTSISVESHPE
ncbi:hypothetical protein J1614_003726 [Plenodomus biglobosus]|nr:hypothetical protein J1614_003726 [Plenodomus biglobosus]